MKTYKKVLKIGGNVLLWLFVAFAVFMAILSFSAQNNADGISTINNKGIITIESSSMEKTINKGDLIFIEMLSDEERKNLEIGDVITFWSDLDGNGEEELNTHRIVDKLEEGGYVYYETKGDNNTIADQTPVMSQNIVGVWTESRIPAIGSILSYLRTSTGFLIFIVLPLVLFFVFELINFIKIVNQIKNKDKKVISLSEEEEIKRKAIEEYLKQQEKEKNEN